MIKSKHGDTLVEVTIAIGIFSMIAIAVASVMSSGTSGSQMALETTLAREEIDAQAEALRFIHSSYVSSKRFEDAKNEYATSENNYRQIWGQIISRANTIETEAPASDTPNVGQFAPSTCDELYDKESPDSLYAQKAFILNLRNLSDPSSAVVLSNYDSIESEERFETTQTYPRVTFGNVSNNTDTQTLVDNTNYTDLYKAYGIYIVGVQDPKTTNISGNANTAAFYDFYIRTCWYGTDATRPSTISTVVRLYDPDVK